MTDLDPKTLRFVAAELTAKVQQIEQTPQWHSGAGHMRNLARDYIEMAELAEKTKPNKKARR